MHDAAVAWAMLKLRLHWELAFRSDAVMALVGSALYVAGSLLTYAAIYGAVDSVAGWDRSSALALVGSLAILLDLDRGLLQGLRHLPRSIRQGGLEQYLCRPAPAPLLLALRGADLRAVWRLPLGLALLAYGASAVPVTAVGVLLYVLSLATSLATFAALAFCLACLSFWLVEMNNLFPIVYDLTEFARYPDSIYAGASRLVFTTVLPLALLASYPVRLLMRGGGPGLLLHQALVLGAFLALGAGLWTAGLRRYAGTGT